VVDGLGNPVALSFTQGSVHDSKEAVPLLGKISLDGSAVLGDKAFGSKEIREYITSQGGTYCIPAQSNVKEPWEVDYARYKERHLGHARTFCVNVIFPKTRKQQIKSRFVRQIKGGEWAVLAVIPAGESSMRGVAVNAWLFCREG